MGTDPNASSAPGQIQELERKIADLERREVSRNKDDEKMLVDLNQARLHYLGYTVTSAVDPNQALELFQSDPGSFELVITDMTMPGMNGDRLSRHILDIREDIPIILCTGYSERISRESAKAAGLAGYLEKPVDMQTLAETVRGVLDTSKNQD